MIKILVGAWHTRARRCANRNREKHNTKTSRGTRAKSGDPARPKMRRTSQIDVDDHPYNDGYLEQ